MTMKAFSPDVTKTNQHCFYGRLLELDNDGIALMDKINHGLDGTVAKHISEWANITPVLSCAKCQVYLATTFNRSIKEPFHCRSERTSGAHYPRN